MKKSPSIPALGAILLFICILIAASVGLVNQITSPIIAKSEEDSKKHSFEDVFPNATDFKDITNDFSDRDPAILEIHQVEGPGGTIGYLYIVSTTGYAEKVKNLVAIDTETNKIKSITILQQNETPGLGANAKTPEFQDRYAGISTDLTLKVVKGPGSVEKGEIQSITASTITSTAVTLGVNTALEHYNSNFNK